MKEKNNMKEMITEYWISKWEGEEIEYLLAIVIVFKYD